MDNYKVYIHVNKINGKRYIGVTKQKVEKRWGNGCNYSSNVEFYADILAYGWENFYHYVLMDNLSKEEAKCNEEFLINLWDTTNKEKGYNVNIGDKCTEETRKKMSKAMRGNTNGKGNKGNSKKVICITTNKVFNSIKEAMEYYNIKSDIGRCCRGEVESCGKLANGVKLQWKYLLDYLDENDSQ